MQMIQSKTRSKHDGPTVISLFTCGMGMDLGFEKAGFTTVYANDIAKFACDTIRKNHPQVLCDEGDITKISTNDILQKTNLRKGETDVIIGGPPCQSFSTAGRRKGFVFLEKFVLGQQLWNRLGSIVFSFVVRQSQQRLGSSTRFGNQ